MVVEIIDNYEDGSGGDGEEQAMQGLGDGSGSGDPCLQDEVAMTATMTVVFRMMHHRAHM
jgi:hypothetical protein